MEAPLHSDAAVLFLGDERERLLEAAREMSRIEAAVETLEISDQAGKKIANDYIGMARMAYKMLEARRTEAKAPILEEGRQIDALFAPAKAALVKIETIAGKKLLARLSAERMEEARRVEAAQAERQKVEQQRQDAIKLAELEKGAAKKEAMLEVERLSQQILAKPDPVFRGPERVESDYASSRINWKGEAHIHDMSMVPRSLLEAVILTEPKAMVQLKKMALAMLNNGPVPGVTLVETEGLKTISGLR